MNRMNSKIRNEKKRSLVRRFGLMCRWCGVTMTLEDATLDHLVTFSAKGSNRLDNLVLACYNCNHRRGNMEVNQWVASQVQKVSTQSRY